MRTIYWRKIRADSVIGFGSEFYRGEMRWDHLLNHAGKVRTALTLGYDQTAIGNQRKAQDRMVVVRERAVDQPIGSKVRLHAGVDSTVDSYRVTQPVYDDPDNPVSARFQELFRRGGTWLSERMARLRSNYRRASS